jgi:hypothetical protein
MLRPSASARTLALVVAATSSATILGLYLGISHGEHGPAREVEALLESARQASALCTSAPTTPQRQAR